MLERYNPEVSKLLCYILDLLKVPASTGLTPQTTLLGCFRRLGYGVRPTAIATLLALVDHDDVKGNYSSVSRKPKLPWRFSITAQQNSCYEPN